MKTRVPSKVRGRGGSWYYPCALCQDDGEMSERAESMVLIKLRTGGEEEWVSVCAKHAGSVGKADSQYELIGLPVLGVSEEFVQAKRELQLQSAGRKKQTRPYDPRMKGKNVLRKKLRNIPRELRD
jgi:hypothetical protein